jgi:hypothetical protein
MSESTLGIYCRSSGRDHISLFEAEWEQARTLSSLQFCEANISSTNSLGCQSKVKISCNIVGILSIFHCHHIVSPTLSLVSFALVISPNIIKHLKFHRRKSCQVMIGAKKSTRNLCCKLTEQMMASCSLQMTEKRNTRIRHCENMLGGAKQLYHHHTVHHCAQHFRAVKLVSIQDM